MTANNDRIRQAETPDEHDNLPLKVGSITDAPWAEDMPDGVILIDDDGDAWQLKDEDWYVASLPDDPITPSRKWGPYEVLWVPKEDA